MLRIQMHIAIAAQLQLLYCCQLVAMLRLLVNVQRRFTNSATMCVVAKYECVASLLQCSVRTHAL